MKREEFARLEKGDAVLWDGTGGKQPTMTGLVVERVGYRIVIAFDDGTGCNVNAAANADCGDVIERTSKISHADRLARLPK